MRFEWDFRRSRSGLLVSAGIFAATPFNLCVFSQAPHHGQTDRDRQSVALGHFAKAFGHWPGNRGGSTMRLRTALVALAVVAMASPEFGDSA